MRILRLKVRNYRGITEREIHFARDGVTVVQGDNESGKTSLAEAIDVIFEHRDDTTRAKVRELQPVGHDVGTEIEIDAEVGPFSFTYSKQFHRDRATTLTIHAPRAEALCGREAHERVRQILAAHVDEALWQALRVQQGSAQLPPDLRRQRSLAAALDDAARGALGGEREASVVDLVLDEYHTYFTPTGRRNAALEATVKDESDAAATVAALQQRVTDLEADTELHALLGTRIEGLRRERESRRDVVRASETEMARLEGAEAEVERLDAEARAAASAQRLVEDILERRRQQVRRLDEMEAQLAALEATRADRAAELTAATDALDAARSAHEQARTRRRAARELARLRRADQTRFEGEARLNHLRAQVDRLASVKAAADGARAELAGSAVDGDTLAALEQAHLAVIEARARVESQAPTVTVEAVADIDLAVDGEPAAQILMGETVERVVPASLTLTVAGLGRVTVQAGRTVASHATALADATEALAEQLAAAGVADLSEARAAAHRRQDAERTLRQLADDQGAGVDLSEVDVASLEAQLAADAAGRPPLPAPAGDVDQAIAMAEQAEAEADRAEGEAEALEQALATAQDAFDEIDHRERRAETLIVEAGQNVAELRTALEADRASSPDDRLDAAVVEHSQAATEAHKAWVESRSALDDRNPTQVAADLAHARSVLAGVESDMRAAENERVAVNERITVRGDEGLHDRLQEAVTVLDEARHERQGWESRAAAAALLHQTLGVHRRQAQQAYQRPLKDQIDRLGRVVFGAGFEVELGDDLEVARRTLDGQTLAVDHLSLGTREQLAVIARLACATLVSADGGVPLILDDALGFSDPGRLERLGVMFATAAADCQVIILTCVPERYRNVAATAVVRL